MAKKPRILVIDDDLIARETFAELLMMEGYETAVAADGLEGLTAVPNFDPDIILLDVMMPIIDGYSVCRRLKSNPQWQHIPVILVTALDSQADKLRGLEAGADDFLSKPIDRTELRARMRTLLRIKRQFDGLQEAIKMREDLIHMAAHDIRSPLTAVAMHCGLLASNNSNLTPSQIESIEAIRSQTQLINTFANDLLVLAKMESGNLVIKPIEVSVASLIGNLQEQYNLMADLVGIDFQVHIEPQRYRIELDRSLFTRTIDNLLANAFKFSSPGEAVTLEIKYPLTYSPQAPRLRVEVIDQGPGIPEKYREAVFDKFKTISMKKQGVPQTGLGLAFCKMSVEAHNGRIFVTDNKPKGAIFVVEI